MHNSRIIKPTLSKLILEAVKKGNLDLKVSMPGRVESYNDSVQKATIQPLFSVSYKAEPTVDYDLPIITEVPVRWDSANDGEAYIHLPLKQGDLGMLIFADRALDNYLSAIPDNNNKIQPKRTNKTRYHDLTDGWFVPGILPFSKALINVNSNDIIIRNGDTRIEIGNNGKIAFKSQSDEIIDILITVLEYIRDGRILTALGSQTWIASDYVKIESMITKLITFKKD